MPMITAMAPTRAIAICALAVALLPPLDARADVQDTAVIHACFNKASGALRVVGPAALCENNESPLSWQSAKGAAPQKVYVNRQDYFSETRISRFMETVLPAGTYLVIAKGSMESSAYGSCNIVSGAVGYETYYNGSSYDNGTKSLAQIMVAQITLATSANVAIRCGNGFGQPWTMTQPVLVALPVAAN